VEQLSVKDSEERNLLSRLIEQERIRKVEFYRRVAAWFEQRGCKDGGESSSWLEEPTTRSKSRKYQHVEASRVRIRPPIAKLVA